MSVEVHSYRSANRIRNAVYLLHRPHMVYSMMQKSTNFGLCMDHIEKYEREREIERARSILNAFSPI